MGFSALYNITKSGNNKSGNSIQAFDTLKTGRVVSIVLDESHPRYIELGGPKAIGAVEVVNIMGSSFDYSTISSNILYTVAYPLSPNIKNYPLINEIVSLTSQPNKEIQTKTTSNMLYYDGIINLWNHPHHNAIPYSAGSSTSQNTKNYQDTEVGSVNKLTTSTGDIKLGEYFKESLEVNPLKPFEGDYLIEGRFNNSLRFGSTGGNNTWSTEGKQGSPIIIVRNGRSIKSTNPWELTIEDINTDLSSVYLTTNQKINFKPSSTNSYLSYKSNKPEQINTYSKNQIIINSGRLVLNAQNDHILFSSAKSINLNAKEGINFDTTGDVILQAGKVQLGSYSATEPVLLGDTTVKQIQEIVDTLKELLKSCIIASNSGGPIPTLNKAGTTLLSRLEILELNKTKSTRVFTV